MARFRRRRYDRRYDYPYQPRPVGGSCLRDACLLDAGCCLGEGLSGNCLVLTLLAGPQLTGTLIAEARTLRRRDPTAGSRLTALLLAGVRTYQREISPRRAPCCHFTPTCSEYAAQALQTHGARRGSWLTIKRLGRCRPRTPTTDDPVPPPPPGRTSVRAPALRPVSDQPPAAAR
ncbi:MAG: membrane protein insertion efficiency factor YidD [Pseudonocardiales bacterium]|nr:membrane protein insertion efficiency factor YidD [Pseudonocardiales bacterium]MBV9032234.1 membrane protein insertion efficiency factor YidD [Pseudonocardiales bacterium]